MPWVSAVIPTVGRPSLAALLAELQRQADPALLELVVEYDRDRRGPAAARNAGWRRSAGEWVVFLDDDVLPGPDWFARLRGDLDVGADIGGVQGLVDVPLPAGRRPTDWERSTAGLATADWVTADMAYRRAALAATGGFDERFRRAYREDAELAHRVVAAGWRLVRGRRRVRHPVRPEGRWISLRAQRGNADDALLRRLYGPHWRFRLGIPAGRRHRHAAMTAAGAAAAGCAAAAGWGRSQAAAAAAAALAVLWLAGTAEFAAARIAAGPRTRQEVVTMIVTSVMIPPFAVAHWLRGWLRSHV